MYKRYNFCFYIFFINIFWNLNCMNCEMNNVEFGVCIFYSLCNLNFRMCLWERCKSKNCVFYIYNV